MQQIYRRTPTLKCDFNKVALQLWRYASVTSLTTIDMCQGWAFVEMELLVKIESGFQPMTIFTKSSILEVWKGSEYASKCNRWILIYYSAVSLPVFESDISRNSHPEVFLEKGVLKICSKFTGEHPCQSVISIKLLCRINESFRNSRTRLDIKLSDYNKTLKAGLTFEGQFEQAEKPFPYILRVVSSEVFTMNISLPNFTIAEGKFVIQRTKMDISNGGLKIPIFCFYSYMI